MATRGAPQHRHQCRFWEPGHLADRGDAAVAQLRGRDRPHAPEPLDRERVEEGQLAVGWHDEQSVRLGHATRHLGEELGPGHADRYGQADPVLDLTPQPRRDLRGGAGDPAEAADVEERLVDREPLDERCRVLEHPEHGLAGLGVRGHPRWDHDRPRAEPAGLRAAHRRPDAEGLGLVAGGEHDPPADEHRPAPQAGIVALLDGGVERVEVGVQDRRLAGHEHMFPQGCDVASGGVVGFDGAGRGHVVEDEASAGTTRVG